jgi:hypothetical protein
VYGWVHFYTDAGPVAEHPVSHLEATLQSPHSLLSDQIVMHASRFGNTVQDFVVSLASSVTNSENMSS